MEHIDKAIGIVIRRLRDNKCMSQEGLSFASDLHRTYISQLERGLKSVTVKSLFKITMALDIEFDSFIIMVKDELGNLRN
jgi:transcriptional regulator with XRE-family HTH domain